MVVVSQTLLQFVVTTVISAQLQNINVTHHPILSFKSTITADLTGELAEHIVYFLEFRADVIVLTRSQILIVDFDYSPPSFLLVAGSSRMNYYAEGRGQAASFNKLTAAVKFNNSHMLATDSSNFVIRMVEIDTGQTSLYSGMPKLNGSRVGERLYSRYKYPFDIIEWQGKFIVSDESDSSIRIIEGDTVSMLFRKPNALFSPSYMVALNGYIYIIIQNKLTRLSIIAPENIEYIIGSAADAPAGYFDGSFQQARFNHVYKIIVYSDSILLVTDYENRAVRLINLQTKRVFSICLISRTSNNLCESNNFGRPFSLLLRNNSNVWASFETGPNQNSTSWLNTFQLQYNGTFEDTTIALTVPATSPQTTADPQTIASTVAIQTTSPNQISIKDYQRFAELILVILMIIVTLLLLVMALIIGNSEMRQRKRRKHLRAWKDAQINQNKETSLHEPAPPKVNRGSADRVYSVTSSNMNDLPPVVV